jgi:hypothetical protein
VGCSRVHLNPGHEGRPGDTSSSGVAEAGEFGLDPGDRPGHLFGQSGVRR